MTKAQLETEIEELRTRLEDAEMLADACRNFLHDHGETEDRPFGRVCHCASCARAVEALAAWTRKRRQESSK